MKLSTDTRGQSIDRNVIGGITVLIVVAMIGTLLVTEFYQATEVTENISGDNLKTTVGDKIPVVFTLIAVLLIVAIAGVMMRALGVL